MKRPRNLFAALTASLVLISCSNAIPKTFDQSKPFDIPADSRAYDLKIKKAFWKLEDELQNSGRQFEDALQQTLRFKEQDLDEQSSSDDWRKDRQTRLEAVRKRKQDLRHQARIKREEIELATSRFMAKQDAELKEFISEMEAKLKEYQAHDGYQNAQTLWNDFKSDLRETLSKGRDRLRLQRPKTEFLD